MFGIWWVTGGIGLIIAVMSLGLMGLFQIKLPQKAYMVSPEADSPGGSFLFGVMTAVLGLPCFGFVAGALVPAAAALGKFGTLLVFGGIGVGMAAPYLVLAAKPSWVSSLPRTGPASELVKQVMGLLLLAAAAYFLGAAGIALVQEHPYLGSKLHYWVIAFFGVLAGGLLAVRTIQIAKSPAAKAIFSAVGLLIGAAGVLVAWNTTEQARADYASSTWEEYSPELVAASTAAGKVVVMDFTAEWCINCKALKAAVLNVDPVRSVLEQPDVVAIKVDLTSDSAPGWDLLRKTYRQTGIPTLVVQGPGANAPWVANAYGPEGVLSAIRAAQGDEAVAAGSAAANR